MGLDSRFFTAPSLQMYFVDKVTGAPLSSGTVTFYKDNARTTPKSVYTISGSPPNYSYVDLGNVITLTGVGTFSDNAGNDIIPYYFPFDGTPEDSTGEQELYYITVTSSGGVEQFTREGWPNDAVEGQIQGNQLENFIPNGQFLLHTDIPADIVNGYVAGEIRQDVTQIAEGGFSFERSSGATSTDFVVFNRIGNYVSNPSASPRYVVNVSCTNTGSGTTFKDLRIKFMDVNKFASPDTGSQNYTFSITGQTNIGTSGSVQIYLIKNFGSGGSTQTETELGTCTFTDSYNICNTVFAFGNNQSQTIGPDNDDFLQIAVRFPTNQFFDMSVTNWILTIGDVDIIGFPQTTNNDFIRDALNAQTFDTQGYDLGLPKVNTLSGEEVDSDAVGDIIASLRPTRKWHFKCDGSRYLTSGYQTTGVPNARLQSVLWNSTALVPCEGTGIAFSTAQVDSSANPTIIRLHPNTAGAATAAADGSVATGFTFANMTAGATTYGVYSPIGQGVVLVWNQVFGTVTASAAGTSGFTVTTIRSGNTFAAQISQVATVAATSLAGTYFTYSTTTNNYYIWFTVAGVGEDPAPIGTGILVKLLTGDTAQTVAQKISNVLNGYECDYITVNKTGSTITAGSYFNFNCLGGSPTALYVWYSKNGVGNDPAPSGRTGINVNVLTADTSAQICTKTVTAINSYYYAVPDFRGQTLRGLDIPNNYDSGPRYSFVDGIYGYTLGTYELDSVLSHSHSYTLTTFTASAPSGGAAGVASGTSTPQTGITGGTEDRPYNAGVNFFIHY